MAKTVPWLLAIVMITAGLCLAGMNESKDPLARTFQQLAPEDKNDFLSYFLALSVGDWIQNQARSPKFRHPLKPDVLVKQLNVSQAKIKKFEDMNIPKESRLKLLNWTKRQFDMSTMNVVNLVRSKKSRGNRNRTILLPDVGEICCPW